MCSFKVAAKIYYGLPVLPAFIKSLDIFLFASVFSVTRTLTTFFSHLRLAVFTLFFVSSTSNRNLQI